MTKQPQSDSHLSMMRRASDRGSVGSALPRLLLPPPPPPPPPPLPLSLPPEDLGNSGFGAMRVRTRGPSERGANLLPQPAHRTQQAHPSPPRPRPCVAHPAPAAAGGERAPAVRT